MSSGRVVERSICEIENVPCWLLVADIEIFTPRSRSLTSDRLASLIGGRIATCKEIIEEHSGTIDNTSSFVALRFFAQIGALDVS
jgi:hypothetical protein